MPFLLPVFPDALLFDLTLSITSISSQSLFDGVRLRLENFPRIFVARRSGGPNLVLISLVGGMSQLTDALMR